MKTNWRPSAEHQKSLRDIQKMYDPGNLEALYAVATEAERRHRTQMYKAARDRERIIFIALSEPGATQKSVGERFHLSQSRVSQLVRRYHEEKAKEE